MRIATLIFLAGLVSPFIPAEPYGPGHRGVDLSAPSRALSPISGTIAFTGEVAGVHTVVVERGSMRVTLQPVFTVLRVGTKVERGDRIGPIVPAFGYHCSGCLHVGVRVHGIYRDPVAVLGRHLVPLSRSAWVE